MEKITKEVLEKWGACESGKQEFLKHFPAGATLQEFTDLYITLTDYPGADSDAIWLYNKCRNNKVFEETTIRGYKNSGHRNSGDWNSGNWNSGNCNSGSRNSGDWNSGDCNSGSRNSGDCNSGHRNSGNWNSGDCNSGHRNSGNWNSGDCNSGDCNSGHRNSGNWNSGDCNSGDYHAGFFNSSDAEIIYAFNKQCKKSDWDGAIKPAFIYEIEVSYWVPESEMTDEDKKSDPDFYIRGGQLRKRDYKEAWRLAYEAASEKDIKLLKELPNFDADVFEDITGIRIY